MTSELKLPERKLQEYYERIQHSSYVVYKLILSQALFNADEMMLAQRRQEAQALARMQANSEVEAKARAVHLSAQLGDSICTRWDRHLKPVRRLLYPIGSSSIDIEST